MSDPPRRRRRPGADHGPRAITDALAEVLADLPPPPGPPAPPPTVAGFKAVFARWEEIVGPALAEHVRPVELRGDELVVAADHPAWATQVRALGDRVLARIGEVAGGAPASLRVIVRPGPGAPGRHSGGGPVG